MCNTQLSCDELCKFYEKLIQQYQICSEVIKVNSLFNILHESGIEPNCSEFLVLLDHMAYDYILINWAKLFGSEKQDLYFGKVFCNHIYSAEDVKISFLKKMNVCESEYNALHKSLRAWRDKVIAHFDFKDVFTITHNDNNFSSISTQCQSLRESIIMAVRCGAKLYPGQELNIPDAERNKTLDKIADDLENDSCDFPRDVTEATIKEMLGVYIKSISSGA